MWRNWQTRQTQNLVPSKEWGFDPLHRHHNSLSFLFFPVRIVQATFPCELSDGYRDQQGSQKPDRHGNRQQTWDGHFFESEDIKHV
jgi:hypothetical protein